MSDKVKAYLFKFELLRREYPNEDIPRFDMDSDIDVMVKTYTDLYDNLKNTTRETWLKSLKSNKHLYARLQYLFEDLLNLKEDDRWIWDILTNGSDEAVRFSNIYLPSLYFCVEEQRLLAKFPIDNKTFEDVVLSVVNNKPGHRVCSSHDIAPIFQKVFELNRCKTGAFTKCHKDFEKKVQKKIKTRN